MILKLDDPELTPDDVWEWDKKGREAVKADKEEKEENVRDQK